MHACISQMSFFRFHNQISPDTKTKKGPEPQLEAVWSTGVHHMEWTQLICLQLGVIYLFPKSDIGKHLSPLPKWPLAWAVNSVSEQNTHILSGTVRLLFGVRMPCCCSRGRQNPKHLEPFCVPPELAVVASYGFILLFPWIFHLGAVIMCI